MQGFNMGRYVPPEQEGIMSGNQLHGKHALGARANKISQGILTVRFEMPYPIWCTHCPKPTIIGQGVRFNAEKKKVGNYHSSPIFSFRLKHVACGGWIEIQTDPKNTAYVVIEGARKRDLGEDKVLDGDIKIMTVEEREAIRNNAFASLEGKLDDKKQLEYSKKRLEELQHLSEKQWEDPYELNKRLRNSFREGRKRRENEAGATAALQDKMSLGLDLLPENEEDARRASFVEFGESNPQRAVEKVISKPLFANSIPTKKSMKSSKRKLKAEQLAEQRTADFAAELCSNTRAAIDPFVPGSRATPGKKLILGVKRKRSRLEDEHPEGKSQDNASVNHLVDYDSS
ncbi:CWC16 protein [Tricladium varicosporioides]|nr:CWC16 protein [Hymenoscyphus varicosporioides]